jgi:hypothetical protein
MQKYRVKIQMILVCLLINYLNLTGQANVMTGTIGLRSDCQSNANGFLQTIGLSRTISKKLEIGLTVGHAFTESQSKIFNENSAKAYVRHIEQPIPEGVINKLWNENSFPGIDISDKGNRYNDLFIALTATYYVVQSNRNNIHAGIGVGMHKKDHSEQINSIYTSEIYWILGGKRTTGLVIPIFSYNTFLDVSLIPSVTYEYKIKQNFGVTFESAAFIYPASRTLSLSQSFGFRLKF